MILPDKNIKLEYSLLNCGALILSEITESQTISSLWDKSKKHEMLVSSREIIYVFLTIFLYLLKCPQSLIL